MAVAVMPGILLSFRRRYVVRCLVIALCIGLAIGGRLFSSGGAEPPRGWVAVNTNFGDVSLPFHDFLAGQFIQQRAAEASARGLIFTEALGPRGSGATEAVWGRQRARVPRRDPSDVIVAW